MKKLYYDIETGPLPRAELEAAIPPFDETEVKTGNLKDPDKIAAKIEEARKAHVENFISRAALDPMTGRVLAIGIDDGVEVRCNHGDEETLLSWFWNRVDGVWFSSGIIIGFNTHLFDLPFLIKRSWALGVDVSPGLRSGKWFTARSVDLRDVWQCGDRQARGGLDAIARFFGIEGKNGSGKDFADLLRVAPDKAMAYLENDVRITRQVAERMGV